MLGIFSAFCFHGFMTKSNNLCCIFRGKRIRFAQVGVAAESGTSMVTLEEMMRTNNHSAITYLKVNENKIQ
jgi:hypothetical protein